MSKYNWLLFLLILEFTLTSQGFLSRIIGRTILGKMFPTLSEASLCLGKSTEFATFLHYSRHHATDSQVLVTGNWTRLRKSGFDPAIPTKMIIHGFLDNMQLSDWMLRMKTELLIDSDCNVIIVDWSCANGLPYFKAVSNSRVVGDEVADFILFLQDSVDADPSTFHLIGHSLGSHISAVVGQRIPNLGRISALDPAGPLFYNASPNQRLDPSDANFVDVIHTDSGQGLLEGLGLQQPVGHVDFYPNGGISQPGCYSSPTEILRVIGFQTAVRHFFTCDHFRAIDIFVESIRRRNCRYTGVTCRDWSSFAAGQCGECSEVDRCALMGFHSDARFFTDQNTSSKAYFLQTSDNRPFCVYQYQVVMKTEGGQAFGAPVSSSAPSRELHLQLSREDGESEKFVLNEQKTDSLEEENTLLYLVTSSDPLDDVTRAKIWWTKKAQLFAVSNQEEDPSNSFKFKKVQIVPIALAERVGRYLGPKVIELCGQTETSSLESDIVELSVDRC